MQSRDPGIYPWHLETRMAPPCISRLCILSLQKVKFQSTFVQETFEMKLYQHLNFMQLSYKDINALCLIVDCFAIRRHRRLLECF
jgi:hypothetical protein